VLGSSQKTRRTWAAEPKLDGRRQTHIDLGPFLYACLVCTVSCGNDSGGCEGGNGCRPCVSVALRKAGLPRAGSVGGGESPTLGNPNASRVHGSHVGCRSRREASSRGSWRRRKANDMPMTSVARRPLPGRGSESASCHAQGCGTQRAISMSVRGAPLGASRASNRRKAPRTTKTPP